ncbi:helix-turn-helix transcriptional regulator [Pseudoalteromonas rubra]|uniref:XRE family transcriptional regulator n=1 Tax=Pseudoalteromonas rubra TaxID=43658 RepID=A0A4Q7EA64_9GAMM|nr:helix-turn-helix transcriptional regulator [Pseudoalteromonas rubra]RZM80146.1 XRE family transcriptional regulator [Pseudoalteromonas rubra]
MKLKITPAPDRKIKETVAKVKANRVRATQVRREASTEAKPPGQGLKAQRVSKNTTSVSAARRKGIASQIIRRLLFGELTQGQALKELRINVLGLKQEVYANLVNISRKTLSDIENDRGNYKTEVLNKAFKPFGLKIGLVPTSSAMLMSILEGEPPTR